MPLQLVKVEEVYASDSNLRKGDAKALLEWADKQPHLPKVTELQALLFLHSCRYRIEQAKTTLDNFFTVRTLCPEIFSLSLEDPLVRDLIDNVSLFTPLPKKSTDGCIVMYGVLVDTRPEKYFLNTQLKVGDFASLLEVSQNGPGKGIRIILDLRGSTVGLVARMNISSIKRFAYYFQEAAPLRTKGIHIINYLPFIDKIMMLIKPFLKKEFFDLIHFHNPVGALYEYVPKEALPSDIGGHAPSVEFLRGEMRRRFNENAEFFEQYGTQLVNESKRPGKPKNVDNIFGTDGNFRKLEVD